MDRYRRLAHCAISRLAQRVRVRSGSGFLMTVEQVRRQLARVIELKDSDPESAHAFRDDLYRDVLFAIAKGLDQGRGPYPGKNYDDDVDLAREALKAENIKLRWEACA